MILDWAKEKGLMFLTLAVITTGLSACVVEDSIQPGLAAGNPVAALGQDGYSNALGASYLLRPADQLSVTVFREENLSVPELTISAEGRVSLPLIGEVQAANMTAQALELRLEELLDARYLRQPDVTVNVLAYGSHVVTVEGSVREPGLYEFRPGTRLTGGMSLAQGPERVADVRDVAIFRQTAQGTMIAKFDYAQVRAGIMLDPVLQPGDRIFVGTDNLSQTWQDVLRTLPALGLFTQL